MSKSCLLSFSFQIYFESSVSFEYLLWLKDLMLFKSLFKCACCHAYVVFCAVCVACSDCGLVNYVFSHAFFLERACFLYPASAWVYDLTLWLAFSSYACVVLRNYRLDIVHAPITDLGCVSVENLV